jgi:hypothetical protein
MGKERIEGGSPQGLPISNVSTTGALEGERAHSVTVQRAGWKTGAAIVLGLAALVLGAVGLAVKAHTPDTPLWKASLAGVVIGAPLFLGASVYAGKKELEARAAEKAAAKVLKQTTAPFAPLEAALTAPTTQVQQPAADKAVEQVALTAPIAVVEQPPDNAITEEEALEALLEESTIPQAKTTLPSDPLKAKELQLRQAAVRLTDNSPAADYLSENGIQYTSADPAEIVQALSAKISSDLNEGRPTSIKMTLIRDAYKDLAKNQAAQIFRNFEATADPKDVQQMRSLIGKIYGFERPRILKEIGALAASYGMASEFQKYQDYLNIPM